MLVRADVLSSEIDETVISTAAWIIVYFFLATGLNLASRSKPERAVMSPPAAVLCALGAVVASS